MLCIAKHSLFQESLRDGRGLVVRNKLKKRGYEPQFDDVNLIESFKKFGIKVESMFENTSPEVSCGWCCLL